MYNYMYVLPTQKILRKILGNFVCFFKFSRDDLSLAPLVPDHVSDGAVTYDGQ
jgi:hypothetical protein